MAENTQVRELWRDAMSGRINRRDVIRRGLALGLSAPVLAALAQETVRGALAAEEGNPSVTFYNWMLNLHPGILVVGDEMGVNVEEAPTTNFSNDRFIAEAIDKNSTWDMYGGVTPFLEMIGLVETGAIEPWDAHLPAGLIDDFHPATREEGTYKGGFYVWPLLLDVCVQASHAGNIAKAGLDPETPPKNWDEFIANAQTVKDSGAAEFGLMFDNRDWRSLIPVTHSISTDVYTAAGLFRYTSDAAVAALEILKRMMPLASADVLAAAGVDNTVLVDEAAFQAEQVGYYFKYQNAPLRAAAQWPDPSQLRLAALPVQEGGAGGTVFWDTGAVLFTYGANKAKAVEFMTALSKDERIWQTSVVGNPDEGTPPVGQLPILQSLWTQWETAPPDWLAANPWARSLYDGMATAKAIAPSIMSITQFDIARPHWHTYLSGEEADPKVAMQKAQDAVAAEFQKQTTNAENPNGQDPGY